MTIRKLRAGRVPIEASRFVGEPGTIFWDEDTGALRLSDGITPGGSQLPISPATSTKVGGIRVGPGINVGSDGLLTIDSAGLPINFGDFYASGNNLSTVNPNEDFNILSNGTGVVNLVGRLHVHSASAGLTDEPIFRVSQDGQIRMLVPLADGTAGALEIIGNDTGVSHPPNQTGVILHVTGNDDMVSRNYFDALNNYALLVGRRYNGSAADTTKVLNGQLFFRIAGQASTETGFETFGPCQIDWVATEDQSPTNQGGEIRIRATPNGSSSVAGIIQVAAFNATTGVTAIKFNGPLSGNVIGNVTGNVTGTILTPAQPNITTVGTLANLTVAGNVTVTNRVNADSLYGKLYRPIRNVGTVAAGGTLTIDFLVDSIVLCDWGDGMVLAYQNFVPGRVIKVIAKKTAGTGTDAINLDGVSVSQVSSGTTNFNVTADSTVFLEIISTSNVIGGVYIKV